MNKGLLWQRWLMKMQRPVVPSQMMLSLTFVFVFLSFFFLLYSMRLFWIKSSGLRIRPVLIQPGLRMPGCWTQTPVSTTISPIKLLHWTLSEPSRTSAGRGEVDSYSAARRTLILRTQIWRNIAIETRILWHVYTWLWCKYHHIPAEAELWFLSSIADCKWTSVAPF